MNKAKEFFQSELGEDWKQELTEIIRTVVKNELDNYSHKCRLDITEKEGKELGFFFRMMKNLGRGQLDHGLKIMQDNHEWLASQRKLGSKVSSFVLFLFISSVVSGALYYLWKALKLSIGR